MTVMEMGASGGVAGYGRPVLGTWSGDVNALKRGPQGVVEALQQVDATVFFVDAGGGEVAAAVSGEAHLGRTNGGWPLLGVVAPVSSQALGDPAFLHCYGVSWPYMTGAMANGIASAEVVIAMGRAGMLGSYGAAGLSLERIDRDITRIQAELGNLPYAVNIIHSPNEPAIEQRTTDLLLQKGVTVVEASAFLGLTPMVVQYRLTGLTRGPDGYVVARNKIIAKISRAETARQFMSPAPDAMVQALLAAGKITAQEAELARDISVADDIIVEADSGGHTDNRPLVALLPVILNARDVLGTRGSNGYAVRVGAAGGISTPASVAGAFQMGAAFVVTGSVNQAAVESGTSQKAREMLCVADIADVIMAPAADMFEMGVKLQVLKRGTMFAMRAQKLYEVYRAYNSLEEVPADEMKRLESQIFRRTIAEVWADTQTYWQKMDPPQLARAQQNPKHKMALCFRWYLGLGSRWAIQGDASRSMDFQVWCGPAMGAFNTWVKGSALDPPAARRVVQIARNLLDGAAALTRAQAARAQGIPVPEEAFQFVPRLYPEA